MVGLVLVVLAIQLPDAIRTPGATNPEVVQATIAQTICNRGHWTTRSIRPPARYTTALKRRQMAADGDTIENPGVTAQNRTVKCVAKSGNPACWEEDHLIALTLGGHPTAEQNLWPQPWFGRWHAGIKDRLEQTLHREVCAGRLSLAAAQTAIRSDWIAAYQQFVAHQPPTGVGSYAPAPRGHRARRGRPPRRRR